VDRVAKEVLELPDWHLQDLEETNLSDVQKAEVIVHPPLGRLNYSRQYQFLH
jgi:hypothetical protein